VIDPKKVIRLTLAYPASTGRNFDEILRWVWNFWSHDWHNLITISSVVDCEHHDLTVFHALTSHLALQLGDKHRITTPVNWNKGDDVIVHPSVANDEAKVLFPEVTFHKVQLFNIKLAAKYWHTSISNPTYAQHPSRLANKGVGQSVMSTCVINPSSMIRWWDIRGGPKQLVNILYFVLHIYNRRWWSADFALTRRTRDTLRLSPVIHRSRYCCFNKPMRSLKPRYTSCTWAAEG